MKGLETANQQYNIRYNYKMKLEPFKTLRMQLLQPMRVVSFLKGAGIGTVDLITKAGAFSNQQIMVHGLRFHSLLTFDGQ